MTDLKGTDLIVEPGVHELTITRDFAAPREQVFALLTDPEQIPHWWGPSYLTTVVDAMQPRSGGNWRFVQTAPDGSEHAFHGVYHDVTGPERIVLTFEYEGTPGHVDLETTVLEDHGDTTRMIVTSVFQSVADRDAMVASGMEGGMRETWERFAEQLAKQS
ncbi:MAG TPA: SRPBCC family protein [Pseudonocardiaceae bacterium]|jgi:uncharacterized protein YndB with AHSA1/START domain|nr:SRPBCC family protein [Pseudonocardiaceae bacterium]